MSTAHITLDKAVFDPASDMSHTLLRINGAKSITVAEDCLVVFAEPNDGPARSYSFPLTNVLGVAEVADRAMA